MSCHPLPEPRGVSTWAEPDSSLGQLDQGGNSRYSDPSNNSATSGALRDYFCRSPEIPDKALTTAASVYATLRKTLCVFSCSLGTQQTQQELGQWKLITSVFKIFLCLASPDLPSDFRMFSIHALLI